MGQKSSKTQTCVNAYVVDAFTRSENGGNAAGVVIDADKLSEAAMSKIASDLGFSETAFVLPSSVAGLRVRFFTPSGEIEMCGHATIATYHLLGEEGRITPGKQTMETMSGILNINYEETGMV